MTTPNQKLQQQLRRAMTAAMRNLLGSGYVPDYYESAAYEFIQIAENFASVKSKNERSRAKKGR